MLRATFLACLMALGLGVSAQIPKIKKPTVKVEAPKINSGGSSNGSGSGSNSGSSSSGNKTAPVGSQDDPSGLFKKITDDVNAQGHRRIAVENLNKLTAEYEKTSIHYINLEKLLSDNEKTLGIVMKLEPEVDRSPYDAKYQPLKARADKEIGDFKEASKLENLFLKEFGAPTDYKTPEVATFRKDERACYCRRYTSLTKPYSEFVTAKKQYETLTANLVGYTDDQTQKILTGVATCIENGNKYAIYAGGEGLEKTLMNKVAEKKDAEPQTAIKYCDEYNTGLDRIISDFSLDLSAEAKSALAKGKSDVNATKKELEEYISSGRYQAYLDKMHAEEIAKVFMPKAGSKNASLESGAVSYVKGAKFKTHLEYNDHTHSVASTSRVVTVSEGVKVVKNDAGIPVYKYYELSVAYKGSDAKCYLVTVYVQYEYMGGGTYSNTGKWSSENPEEMACANVNK